MSTSPWVQRAEAGTLAGKALVDGFAASSINFACAYCGYSVTEGAIIILVESAFGPTNLCRSCSEDKVLGACGHSRTCDCLAGICDMGW